MTADDIVCSFEMARALLIKNDWNRKAVVDHMATPDYIEKTFKFDPKAAQADISGLIQSTNIACAVCYEEFDE